MEEKKEGRYCYLGARPEVRKARFKRKTEQNRIKWRNQLPYWGYHTLRFYWEGRFREDLPDNRPFLTLKNSLFFQSLKYFIRPCDWEYFDFLLDSERIRKKIIKEEENWFSVEQDLKNLCERYIFYREEAASVYGEATFSSSASRRYTPLNFTGLHDFDNPVPFIQFLYDQLLEDNDELDREGALKDLSLAIFFNITDRIARDSVLSLFENQKMEILNRYQILELKRIRKIKCSMRLLEVVVAVSAGGALGGLIGWQLDTHLSKKIVFSKNHAIKFKGCGPILRTEIFGLLSGAAFYLFCLGLFALYRLCRRSRPRNDPQPKAKVIKLCENVSSSS